MTLLSGTQGDEPDLLFSRALHDNYRSTDYICQNYRLQPGVEPLDFQAFLRQNGWRTFSFITAWNPFSGRSRSLAENQQAQAELEQKLGERNLTFLPAVARDQARKWPEEPGIFVFDTPLAQMLDLGTQFGQNAILWGEVDGTPEALWCHGNLGGRPVA